VLRSSLLNKSIVDTLVMGKDKWFRHTIGIALLALVIRKVLIGREAMRVVGECKAQIDVENMVS
jgi:hypothetical protein